MIKGYTQFFYLDYGDMFFLVTKIAFVCLFIAMTNFQRWSLYQVVFYISSNIERIKYIKIDYHFIKKIISRDIKIEFVNLNDQLVDIFINASA